jgi:hypothetical protein
MSTSHESPCICIYNKVLLKSKLQYDATSSAAAWLTACICIISISFPSGKIWGAFKKVVFFVLFKELHKLKLHKLGSAFMLGSTCFQWTLQVLTETHSVITYLYNPGCIWHQWKVCFKTLKAEIYPTINEFLPHTEQFMSTRKTCQLMVYKEVSVFIVRTLLNTHIQHVGGQKSQLCKWDVLGECAQQNILWIMHETYFFHLPQ